MTFAIEPGPLDRALEHADVRLENSRFAEALWARRLDVWTTDAALQQKIADRLGWLAASDTARPHVPRLRTFAHAVRDAGLSDVVVLGMGGSSAAADVLRAAIGVAPGYPRLHVLDSIDPDAVRPAMERAATSLFLVASKSGTTIEVSTLAAEAERRVQAAHVPEPGSRFVAITDEHTPLHRRAIDRRFREVFINPADVGGRFSALTFFGLVPAALMGIELDALLASAQSMADACRDENPRRNPGLALGALLAAAAVEGRDKLRLAMPRRLERLGLWIEQLVAESTGKQGKGLVPVVGEAANTPLGDDGIVVAVTSDETREFIDRARAARAPVVTLEMPDVTALGAEFFRWEVAAATAGFLLDINPFDEPNVQQAKDATRALLATYRSERRLPLAEPLDTARGRPDGVGSPSDPTSQRWPGGPRMRTAPEGVRVTVTAPARDALAGDTPPALLRVLHPRDYVALLVYLPPDDARFAPILEELRTAVATTTGCATMLGYGPRYLHSTGQLHKGGPNTGVFVIVTADPAEDLPVPAEPYSFGVLEMAQAVGDFQALERAGRRAVHLHLPRRDAGLLRRVCEWLLRAG